MSVTAAAGLLAAAGTDAAPVVDSDGRCLGLFTAGDYRRWLAGEAPVADFFSAGQMVATDDKVREHMTRRFGTVSPEAGISELLLLLRGAADPFLVVLDPEGRPLGVVCGLDVLVAEANAVRSRKRVWPVEVV
jgi:CBS-domain-containing membrane protein